MKKAIMIYLFCPGAKAVPAKMRTFGKAMEKRKCVVTKTILRSGKLIAGYEIRMEYPLSTPVDFEVELPLISGKLEKAFSKDKSKGVEYRFFEGEEL